MVCISDSWIAVFVGWVSPNLEWGHSFSTVLPHLATAAESGSWSTLQAIFIFTLLPLWLVSLILWGLYRRKSPLSESPPLSQLPSDAASESEDTRVPTLQQLLSTVAESIGDFVEHSDEQMVCNHLLARMVKLSGSECGYIGQWITPSEGKPFLRPISFAHARGEDPFMNPSHAYFKASLKDAGSLYARVLESQASLMIQEEGTPTEAGLPGEISKLKSFLGVPLFIEKKMVGMIGLANRPGGYDDSLVSLMDPLWKNCTGLLKCRINMESQFSLLQDLELSEIRLQTLLSSVVDGIVTIDDQGSMLTFNPAAERLFGYSSDEVMGKNVKMLMPEPYAAEHDEYLRKYLETRKANIIGIGREVRGLRKNGVTFPLHLAVSEMYVGGKRRFVGIIRDITELKKAVKEQEYLASIVDGTHDAIIGWNLEGVVTSWNQGAVDMYRYTPDEIVGRSVQALVPAFCQQELKDIMDRVKTGEHIENFETQRLGKEGRLLEVSLTLSPILDDEGSIIGASTIARDITQRKEAEQALEESRKAQESLFKRYQSILDAAGEGIYGLDSDGVTTFCNPAGARMLGYNVKELIGKPQHQLIHHSKPGGEPFPREECSVYRAIRDGRVYRVENEVFWRKDGSSFPVEYVGTPIMEQGRIVGAVVTFRDITLRKQAERQLETAREAEKNANNAKSDFLANMSHEIRTPMNAILGYAQLMERDSTLNAEQKENIKKILTGGDHLLELINDILDFSKIEAGRLELSPVDFELNNFVRRLSHLIQGRCREKSLTWNIENSLKDNTYIKADETKLRQILINLLGNAVKFTRKGGVKLRIDSPSENNYRFEVVDTGIGISKESLERIFEAFDQVKTAHDEGGTGLGLAITRKLVELMGGRLTVESEVGKGASFSFSLMLPNSRGAVVKKETPRKVNRIGLKERLKVLVVDDIQENRDILSTLLNGIGAEVITAEDGEKGVSLTNQHQPHMVFMDIRMPGMGGVEAIRQIRKKFDSEQVKIVLVTASVFEHQAKEAIGAGGDGFLPKPFRVEELFNIMDSLLQVNFIYEEEVPEKQEVGLDGLDLKTIKLESEVLSRLKNASDLYSVTDLSQALEDLEKAGEAEKQLADYLRSLGKAFKMAEISEVLDQLSER